ncbi:LPS-induced tumor necrosis factor alpha factor [Ostreococcus tauri]|uniref:LPS-induced tumor necrosis factor alpha factor n=1 Tax=Ostreococcus tauri TaxID=70448 RepID=Q00US5_OSTTA|nr:LPS-induced tumor necrosis factor alpha factor [Ostreococcus tauri]OUS44987.1 hypothetical protein BE221DRAFT_148107 [Ostreococcus tauri]CAL57702.1 LPS-induced tumor necrosis factor alpha factor [Ostreococcus tauri]|eukprot:XP_003083426.1 LPS-induced tumor necrosis factor alpha factor [Ostreococcus tauri]
MDKSSYYPDPDAYRPTYVPPHAQQANAPTVVVLPATQQPQRVQEEQIPVGLPVHSTRPAYLGATQGHGTQVMTCPHCGHSGPADVVRVKGASACFAAIVTFGLSACLCGDSFSDTYHHCAQCDAVLAMAKMA